MKSVLSFLVIFLLTYSVMAQSPCPCCTDQHRQFDFWAGNWQVHDTTGNLVGTNRVELIQDSCVLKENWIGAKVTTGTSYNYFDPSDSSWNQLWLDNQGTILKLKGGLIKREMVLKSDPVQGRNGLYINRITWTPLSDGRVTQTWDALSVDGVIRARLFKGIYTPLKK